MQLTQQNEVLFLQGDATMFCVTDDDMRHLAQLCTLPIHTVDLSGIDAADSSCVALLLAIKRYLGNQTWRLRSVPPAVTALIQLYELEWLT